MEAGIVPQISPSRYGQSAKQTFYTRHCRGRPCLPWKPIIAHTCPNIKYMPFWRHRHSWENNHSVWEYRKWFGDNFPLSTNVIRVNNASMFITHVVYSMYHASLTSSYFTYLRRPWLWPRPANHAPRGTNRWAMTIRIWVQEEICGYMTGSSRHRPHRM